MDNNFLGGLQLQPFRPEKYSLLKPTQPLDSLAPKQLLSKI